MRFWNGILRVIIDAAAGAARCAGGRRDAQPEGGARSDTIAAARARRTRSTARSQDERPDRGRRVQGDAPVTSEYDRMGPARGRRVSDRPGRPRWDRRTEGSRSLRSATSLGRPATRGRSGAHRGGRAGVPLMVPRSAIRSTSSSRLRSGSRSRRERQSRAGERARFLQRARASRDDGLIGEKTPRRPRICTEPQPGGLVCAERAEFMAASSRATRRTRTRREAGQHGDGRGWLALTCKADAGGRSERTTAQAGLELWSNADAPARRFAFTRDPDMVSGVVAGASALTVKALTATVRSDIAETRDEPGVSLASRADGAAADPAMV